MPVVSLLRSVGNKVYERCFPIYHLLYRFFKTGKPPVRAEETIEIFAFMEAADESKRQGGKPVTLATVVARAREQIAKQK